jgi:hypothetical protein
MIFQKNQETYHIFLRFLAESKRFGDDGLFFDFLLFISGEKIISFSWIALGDSTASIYKQKQIICLY